MYILFLDESGKASTDTHFILGGLAVFEGLLYTLRDGLDNIIAAAFPNDPHKTFHASELYRQMSTGQLPGFERNHYITLLDDIANLIVSHNYAYDDPARPGVILVGQVIARASVRRPPKTPKDDNLPYYLEGFKGALTRFHSFLRDLGAEGNPQHGLAVMATWKQQSHNTLKETYALYREEGTHLGYISRIPILPLFTESASTRLLQLADMVAYALHRAYNRDDWKYFRPLTPAFYKKHGVFATLYHKTPHSERCPCPACVSRQHSQPPLPSFHT